MHTQSHHLLPWASAALAVLSVSGAGSIIAAIVLFIVWQRRSS
ncbi:hypothetical protein ACH0BO_07395 [Brevibacterium luteolum]